MKEGSDAKSKRPTRRGAGVQPAPSPNRARNTKSNPGAGKSATGVRKTTEHKRPARKPVSGSKNTTVKRQPSKKVVNEVELTDLDNAVAKRTAGTGTVVDIPPTKKQDFNPYDADSNVPTVVVLVIALIAVGIAYMWSKGWLS